MTMYLIDRPSYGFTSCSEITNKQQNIHKKKNTPQVMTVKIYVLCLVSFKNIGILNILLKTIAQ